MTTAAELAERINRELPRWAGLERVERAQVVILWCQQNGIDTSSILARPLAAAMALQPYWMQGPENYLDMVKSIAAFLAAR